MLQAQLVLQELKVSPHTRERVLQKAPATFSRVYVLILFLQYVPVTFSLVCISSDFALEHVSATAPF